MGGVSEKLSVAGLEHELSKISGVRRVRVIGGAHPSEIHVVAGRSRSPKQIVRDVQSLAVAGFGVSIDHRIVSVVQIDEDVVAGPRLRPATIEAPTPGRPIVELVLTSAEGGSRSVRVILRWPNGSRSEGKAASGTSKDLQARAAMEATVKALGPALEPSDTRIEVEHAFVQPVGRDEAVIVKATVYERDEATTVTGAVLVDEEVAGAGVRALLHGVNRKLRSPASDRS